MPLAFFFFLRFLRFFLGFVGASAESLPGPLALDWTAILLCFGSLPVRGAALGQQMHCQSLSLGGARRAIYFFGDVVGGALPGVVLLGDRWRDSSRPAVHRSQHA